MRKLIQAAVYRKFIFESQEDLERYMNSGHQERWIVRNEKFDDGQIVAVIGERYNGCWKLVMEEIKCPQVKHS